MKIIGSKEVNTGRQTEYDYLKGMFMPFIFLIHAYQATGSEQGPFVSVIYIFATMSGAAIYIFVAGFGTAYDSSSSPAVLCRRGIRLIVYQYLTNILYVLALLVPYPFVKNALNAEGAETFRVMTWVYIQFINIFFITGVIYLILALLKKIGLPLIGYLIAGVVTSLAAPAVYGTQVDVPGLGYVVTLLIGEAPFVSFTPLYFLPYALIGVAAGRIYRKITDKTAFYKRMIPVSVFVILIWWISVYVRLRYPTEDLGYITDLASFSQMMDYAYSCPDLWHVIASLAHIMLFAGMIFICGRDRKPGIIRSQFLYYSRHITGYYAVHLAVYLVAFGMHSYMGFEPPAVWILTLISMITTEIIIRSIDLTTGGNVIMK